jgi:CubicO group peptidase (beta-lactamase class C family)
VREHAPSSTLQSNVEDMLRFARAALAKSPAIMPAAAWERMFTPDPYVLFPDATDPAAKAARMGLGWFTARLEGKLFVLHPGQDDGFRSLLILDPESNAAVVLMTNSDWDEGGDKPDGYIGTSPAIAQMLSLGE